MNCSTLRFVRHAGMRRSYGVRPLPIYNTTTVSRFNRQTIGAAYSSLSRESSEGKSVIITGSSRGIGKAIALRLAADGVRNPRTYFLLVSAPSSQWNSFFEQMICPEAAEVVTYHALNGGN